MLRKYSIMTIIDRRADGSYIYMSHVGVLNLDSNKELLLAQDVDREWLRHHNQG